MVDEIVIPEALRADIHPVGHLRYLRVFSGRTPRVYLGLFPTSELRVRSPDIRETGCERSPSSRILPLVVEVTPMTLSGGKLDVFK